MKWDREFMSDDDREEIDRDRDRRNEAAIDRADYLRDEMLDRQMEAREAAREELKNNFPEPSGSDENPPVDMYPAETPYSSEGLVVEAAGGEISTEK